MNDTTSWTDGATASMAARDALLRENLSLVYFVAKQLSRSLSADASMDEMINIGTLGLMSALKTFDATRGLAFSTYAVPRIRGAILDELRRQDHVPRSIRRKMREMAQARETLMRTLTRAPRDAEVAAVIGIDVETLWRWQADIERTVQVSIDANDGDADAAPSPIAFLPSVADSADVQMEKEEELAELRTAITQLNEQPRTVLSLYYFEELNAREIADVLGLSESRVSQIRAKGLADLRQIMRPLQASA